MNCLNGPTRIDAACRFEELLAPSLVGVHPESHRKRAKRLLRPTLLAPFWATAGAAQNCPEFVVRQSKEYLESLPMRTANEALSTLRFCDTFLDGYLSPGGALCASSQLDRVAYLAGQRARKEHPDGFAQTVADFGYVPFSGAGTWTVGFEVSAFEPDTRVQAQVPSPYLMWASSAGMPVEFPKALQRQSGAAGRLHSARVYVEGYVSPQGKYGHLGMYSRLLLVVAAHPEEGYQDAHAR